MLSPERLSAVLFDLDGTLIPPGRGRARVEPEVETDETIAAAVRAIARSYRVGLVSDGGAKRQRAKLLATGLEELMSVVVISGEVGAQKPSRRIFAHALAQLRCAPGNTLFVGDDPRRDLEGARAAGLVTCWVARGRAWPPGRACPELIVRTVAELPEVLAC